MKRKLFTFFSALSLLLCAAVCVLWVRSYFVAYSPRFPSGWATSRRGNLSVDTAYPLGTWPRFLPLEWRSGPPERFGTLSSQLVEFDSLERTFGIVPGMV